MKLKLQALAAAAALVAVAGHANALTRMDDGNSSLAFVAMDDNGTKVSYFADLGTLMSSFVPANNDSSLGSQPAGALLASNVVWNFNTNTMTVNGVQQAGTFSYSTQFASFLGSAQSADMQWAVIAGDTFDNRFLTTGSPTTAEATSQEFVANMANVNNLYAANGLLGTHAAGVAGSNTAAGGTDAYVGGQWFGNDGKWVGGLTYSAFAGDNQSNKFEYLSATVAPASYTQLPGTFTFNSAAGTLTYSVAAVPEGDGLALAMAGLGLLGFVARRRQAK